MNLSEKAVMTSPSLAVPSEENRLEMLMKRAIRDEESLTQAYQIKDELNDRLCDLREHLSEHPLANPVLNISHDLSERLSNGTLPADILKKVVHIISCESFVQRACRTSAYIGLQDEDTNRKSIRSVLFSLCQNAKTGEVLPFEVFQAKIERAVQGIVITAHPTFGLSEELYQIMAQLCADETLDGIPLTEEKRLYLIKEVIRRDHRPNESISLQDESRQAQNALLSLQGALRVVYEEALSAAIQFYPSRWKDLTPRFMTIASWVGYDLDGRTDITWTNTLHSRMQVQSVQLENYARTLEEILDTTRGQDSAFVAHLESIRQRLLKGLAISREEQAFFSNSCPTGEELRKISRQIVEDDRGRIVRTDDLIACLSQALDLTDHVGLQYRIQILKAEMSNYGLAISHMHMRLNATQLHNAIRKTITMDGQPNEAGRSRGNIVKLNHLLDEVQPIRVNYGDLSAENTTAKRTFMLLAQILKHVDANQPIRFLIAECETPFSLLTALYYARLFGVDELLDISPLFETSIALERGAHVIEELLQNRHYRSYVQKRRRLSIQTGFSDAGRYLGQVAACLAIERLHQKIARVVEASGLDDVEVLVFDTHGESMGRGAHPRTIQDRMKYLFSPQTRGLYRSLEVGFKHEISFQGGDGYLMMQTPKMALSLVTRMLDHAFSEGEVEEDVFYEDTSYSLDFFLGLKSFHEAVMENRDYAALLSTFGTNLLFNTGSRKSKRQHERRQGIDVAHPSQIRAIPHNAILQQLGYMANSASGFGTAVSRDLDSFVKAYRNSDRIRRFMDLVSYAKGLSSLNTPEAYAALFDPRHWLLKAYAVKGTERGDDFLKLSSYVSKMEHYEAVKRMLLRFREDALKLHKALDALEQDGQSMGFPFAVERRINLLILHIIRVCVIQRMFLLAVGVPEFAMDNDFTKDDIAQDILGMEIPAALSELRATFPVCKGESEFDKGDYGEPSDYHDELNRDYSYEHQTIFAPLEECYDLCRRISVAISCGIGAHG